MEVHIGGNVTNTGSGAITFTESKEFSLSEVQDIIKLAEKAHAEGDEGTLKSVVQKGFAFSKELGRYLVGRYFSPGK